MSPEQIAKLQEALGVSPTGVLDQTTLSAMQMAQKQAGLRAHAGREVQADLARVGHATTPEGVEMSLPVDHPPRPQVVASEGVGVSVVPESGANRSALLRKLMQGGQEQTFERRVR